MSQDMDWQLLDITNMKKKNKIGYAQLSDVAKHEEKEVITLSHNMHAEKENNCIHWMWHFTKNIK